MSTWRGGEDNVAAVAPGATCDGKGDLKARRLRSPFGRSFSRNVWRFSRKNLATLDFVSIKRSGGAGLQVGKRSAGAAAPGSPRGLLSPGSPLLSSRPAYAQNGQPISESVSQTTAKQTLGEKLENETTSKGSRNIETCVRNRN